MTAEQPLNKLQYRMHLLTQSSLMTQRKHLLRLTPQDGDSL